MILLDGQTTCNRRLEKLRTTIQSHFEETGRRPGLAVVRVGEDPASKIYVGRKIKACEKVGIHSIEHHLDAGTTTKDLLERIQTLNRDTQVHGILVQLPLPKTISERTVLEAVSPSKDVDGFHPINLGKLVIGEASFIACTPLGIMNLLDEYKISLKGRRAVVIGRSRIVGRPMSLLLDQAGATVTVVHSQTLSPETLTREADIVVAAVGKPNLVTADWIKPGAVVVDVGINRLPDGKICGDVDFHAASAVASHLTPVPGGVGPMTIATLLENTWKSFQDSGHDPH